VTGLIPFLVLPQYFVKLRGLATALFLAGISLGQVLLPLLTQWLHRTYGQRGAVLLHGGVLLNTVVAVYTFRPVTPSPGAALTIKSQKSEPLSKVLSRVGQKIMSNFAGLRERRMVVPSLSSALLLMGYINFTSLMSFAMLSHGHTSDMAALAVAMTGVGNLTVRFLMSFIADRKWIKKRPTYVCGAVLAAGCSTAFPLAMASPRALLSLQTLGSCGLAAANSLSLVLMIEGVGLARYDTCIALQCVFMAGLSVSLGPILDLLMRLTGSWFGSLWACAAMQALSAAIWLAI